MLGNQWSFNEIITNPRAKRLIQITPDFSKKGYNCCLLNKKLKGAMLKAPPFNPRTYNSRYYNIYPTHTATQRYTKRTISNLFQYTRVSLSHLLKFCIFYHKCISRQHFLLMSFSHKLAPNVAILRFWQIWLIYLFIYLFIWRELNRTFNDRWLWSDEIKIVMKGYTFLVTYRLVILWRYWRL